MERINVLLALMIVASFLLANTLHGFAEATMAAWLGDSSGRAEGRQSLRIPSHIDPVGLLMCIILAFQPIGTAPVGLGWGKPLKPDVWKMRVGQNVGLILIALAGMFFNLFVGLLVGFLLSFTEPYLLPNPITERIFQFLLVFACTNVALAIFNLIPLYPLAGYQIVFALLPNRQANQFARSAPYGPFIILAIFFFLPFLGQLARIQNPIFQLAYYIWLGAAQLVGLVIREGFPLVYTLYTL